MSATLQSLSTVVFGQTKNRRFLCDLREILLKADPDLSEDAQTALLSRQFMKCLTDNLRLRLLEQDPTPTLKTMEEFVQRYRAITLGRESLQLSVCLSGEDAPLLASLRRPINNKSFKLLCRSVTHQHAKQSSRDRRPSPCSSVEREGVTRVVTRGLGALRGP